MDDKEKHDLAVNILDWAIQRLLDKEVEGEAFYSAGETPDGLPGIIYREKSDDGYGEFIHDFFPLASVEKIISECEHAFDEYVMPLQTEDGVVKKPLMEIVSDEVRMRQITVTAQTATLALLSWQFLALTDALLENFEDARLIIKAMTGQTVKRVVDATAGDEFEPIGKIDTRPEINEAAERVANAKRARLRALFGSMNDLIAETKRGPKEKFTLDDVRRARDRLKTEGRPSAVLDISVELGCDESAIRKRLKKAEKTLDAL